MILESDLELELQRSRANGLYALLQSAAATHQLSFAFVLGVASRETSIQNELGDGGHGVGVLQIDIRYHEIALQAKESGSWKTDPGPLIDYGAGMLASNVAWAKETFPQYGGENGQGWLKIAASAYNAGQIGAKTGVEAGDSDLHTTGKNYGKDVLQRMAIFEQLIG